MINYRNSSSIGSCKKGLLLKLIFLKAPIPLNFNNSLLFPILLEDRFNSFSLMNYTKDPTSNSLLLLRSRDSTSLRIKGETQSAIVMPLPLRQTVFILAGFWSVRKEDKAIYLFLFICQLITNYYQNLMTQKYYHNDYKKLTGVDQTRTASQKLLDKALGGLKTVTLLQDKPLEKKVKQEHSNLSPLQILAKINKNIDANSNAAKLTKPLSILKKCLEDPVFVDNQEVKQKQWPALLDRLLGMQERLVGNYSELILVNDSLIQILTLLLSFLENNKEGQDSLGIKKEIKQQKQEITIVNMATVQKCKFQLQFCKMLTDDSFTFHNAVKTFKQKIFKFFQNILEHPQQPLDPQLNIYVQSLLPRMFKLQHKKYQWAKTSLTNFFKDFNINYKHLLEATLAQNYLLHYNTFINTKINKGLGEQVNIMGGSKGGKISQVEVISSDGYDRWAQKQ